MKWWLLAGLFALASIPLRAQNPDSLQGSRPHKDNYWNRLIHGNVDRTFEKKLDLSFIVSPSYGREASFGIGGVATGLYRSDRSDRSAPPSNLSLTGNVSVTGFYSLSLFGNHYLRGNRSRFSYKVLFGNKPLNFWGISYDACAANDPIAYTRRQIRFDADYVYNLTSRFHVGTALTVNSTKAVKIDDVSYLAGQRRAYFLSGIGALIQYDTRDFIPNPQKGILLSICEVVYPECCGDAGRTLCQTTVQFNCFRKLWKGGILASDLYGRFNSADVPWTMREAMGDDGCRMRGYYAGQYSDNDQIVLQLEIRQHLRGRLGAVVWGGCGSVFPSFGQFNLKNVLPNYGLGLRIEVKHRVNLRVDYGFGKQTGGLVLNFGEAF